LRTLKYSRATAQAVIDIGSEVRAEEKIYFVRDCGGDFDTLRE
jgi:hypothetical protein